jgi:hypothetical protein
MGRGRGCGEGLERGRDKGPGRTRGKKARWHDRDGFDCGKGGGLVEVRMGGMSLRMRETALCGWGKGGR